MRDILFKAKRLDNREWVEGFYHYTDYVLPPTMEHVCRKYYILPIGGQDAIEIDEKTLCQYTGLEDKNGTRIWENDIMKYVWDGEECIDVIEYQAPVFTYSNSFRWSLDEDEVIGNIFDNAELLSK